MVPVPRINNAKLHTLFSKVGRCSFRHIGFPQRRPTHGKKRTGAKARLVHRLFNRQTKIENIGAAEKAQIKECLADAKSRMLYFRERLVSDCYKVKYCFDKDADLRKLVVDESSYCSNDKKIHAELNLRAFLKENNIYPVYVGISKPSCLTCHTQFQIDEEREVKLLHIGTHGVSYIIDSADLPDDTLFDSEFVFRITHRAFHKSSVDNPQFRPIDPADQNLSISPIGETFYSSDSHGFYIPVYLGEY